MWILAALDSHHAKGYGTRFIIYCMGGFWHIVFGFCSTSYRSWLQRKEKVTILVKIFSKFNNDRLCHAFHIMFLVPLRKSSYHICIQ